MCGLALAADPWAPPPTYYDSAVGTGGALQTQLYDVMRTGHIQRAYGDFRQSAALHDADPDIPGRVLLAYNRASVNAGWDSGATWNREHVWPQSRQPGSASNSSTGNLGDPHALLPCNPGINSSRGNKPFGWSSTTGNHGSQGTHYFPGDTDKGDIARSLMYSDTRWGPELGIALVNGTPSGNQMGDLASLVAWHYLDPPDDFERRRNHVIASNAENPIYFTNNRNAFVDRPEYVWSVYMDQNNDTQLSVAVPDADGFSWLPVALDPVFVGSTPPSVAVTLDKTGADGTFYEVSVNGDAASASEGRHNVFPINLAAFESGSVDVSIDPAAAATPGAKTGDVYIDNLDVTTGHGIGSAALDFDDIISVAVDVLDHAEGSFESGADTNTLGHDFGTVDVGLPTTFSFPVHNLEAAPGFTGSLWIVPGAVTGDAAAFSLELVGELVAAGGFVELTVTLDTSAAGSYAATVEILAGDDPTLAGAAADEALVLTLTGTVGVACLADLDGNGILNVDDVDAFIAAFVGADLAADLDGNGILNVDDVDAFVSAFVGGCP
ncbi:MAG: hypothetical protein DHS20C14_03890 [Phycisphaeraceae bacterium]|nr:MAG: hypothetical protein DHS20C14_03890 [Phycisphaeraceae bacterium]